MDIELEEYLQKRRERKEAEWAALMEAWPGRLVLFLLIVIFVIHFAMK